MGKNQLSHNIHHSLPPAFGLCRSRLQAAYREAEKHHTFLMVNAF